MGSSRKCCACQGRDPSPSCCGRRMPPHASAIVRTTRLLARIACGAASPQRRHARWSATPQQWWGGSQDHAVRDASPRGASPARDVAAACRRAVPWGWRSTGPAPPPDARGGRGACALRSRRAGADAPWCAACSRAHASGWLGRRQASQGRLARDTALRRASVLGAWGWGTAQQGFAGDGKQPPLVPRSGSFPRLKPGVRHRRR